MNRFPIFLLALWTTFAAAFCEDIHPRNLPLCTDVAAPAMCKVIYKVTPGASTFNTAYQMLLNRTGGGVIEIPPGTYTDGDTLTYGYNDATDAQLADVTLRGLRDPITGDRPRFLGTRATNGRTLFNLGGRIYQGIFWNPQCSPPATADMTGFCRAQNHEPRSTRSYAVEDIEITGDIQGPWNVTAATNALDTVLTVENGHTIQAGDFVQIRSGWSRIDGLFYTVTAVNGNQVTLPPDTSSTTNFPPGQGVGKIRIINAWRQGLIFAYFKHVVVKNTRVSFGFRSGVTNSEPAADAKGKMEICNSQFDHNGDGANTGHNLYLHGNPDYYEGEAPDNYLELIYDHNTCYAAKQAHCLKVYMNKITVTNSLFRQGVITGEEFGPDDTEWEGTEVLDIGSQTTAAVGHNTFSHYGSRWRSPTGQTIMYFLARGDVCGAGTPHICDPIPSLITSVINMEPAAIGTAPDYISAYHAKYRAAGTDTTMPNPSAATNPYLFHKWVFDNDFIELNPAAANTTYAMWAVSTYPMMRIDSISIYHDMDETEWSCKNAQDVTVAGPFRIYQDAVTACAAAGATISGAPTTYWQAPVASNWLERLRVWRGNNRYRGYMRTDPATNAVPATWNRGFGTFGLPTNPKDTRPVITNVCGENTTPCTLPAWFKTQLN